MCFPFPVEPNGERGTGNGKPEEKEMKAFNHVNAKSLAEVQTALADGKTNLIAGGTDLLGTLKDNILRT